MKIKTKEPTVTDLASKIRLLVAVKIFHKMQGSSLVSNLKLSSLNPILRSSKCVLKVSTYNTTNNNCSLMIRALRLISRLIYIRLKTMSTRPQLASLTRTLLLTSSISKTSSHAIKPWDQQPTPSAGKTIWCHPLLRTSLWLQRISASSLILSRPRLVDLIRRILLVKRISTLSRTTKSAKKTIQSEFSATRKTCRALLDGVSILIGATKIWILKTSITKSLVVLFWAINSNMATTQMAEPVPYMAATPTKLRSRNTLTGTCSIILKLGAIRRLL